MITKEMQLQGNEVIQTVFKKIWSDSTFKAEFLKNPKQEIEKITGQKLNISEDISLIAEDQSNTSFIYLNIPRKIDVSEFELTDEQLEMIAGGEIGIGGAILIGLGSAAVGVAVGYLAVKCL